MKRLILALMLLLIGGGIGMTQAQTTGKKVDKKTEKLVKKLKERLSGNLQLDLFAGFAF